jgi:sulfur relay (sulfurtransferase) DsrC/TusE family protein
MNSAEIDAAKELKLDQMSREIDRLVNDYIYPYGASHMNRVMLKSMANRLQVAAKNAKRPEKVA